MAITDPRPFPGYLVGNSRMYLQRTDLMTPEASGQVGGVQDGWPLWRGEWEMVALNTLQAQKWGAWRRSLRGAIRHFIGIDPARVLPAVYRPTSASAGGLPGSFNGDASSYSLNTDHTVVTLNGMGAGFILTEGDLVGFRNAAGTRHLPVEVVEGATANGSGVMAVTVEPAVHAIVASWTSPVAYVYRPGCYMRMTPETEDPVIAIDGIISGKLVAVQDIRA